MEIKTFNILIIEDLEIFSLMLKKFLETMNNKLFNPTISRSLSHAITILKNNSFDVIITDLGLPDSSGLNTLINVYASANYTPIIVLTGENDYELELKALEYGAEDFISKDSINVEILEKSIVYAIERSNFKKSIFKKDKSIRSFINNSKDAIVIIDKNDFKIKYVNYMYEILFDKKLDSITDTKFEIDFSGEKSIEYQKDNQIFEISAVSIEWNENSSYLVSFKDVTQNKLKENELKESEQTLKTIFESILTGIILIDYNTKEILDINPMIEEIYGYKKDVLVGKNYINIIYEDNNNNNIIDENKSSFTKEESLIVNKNGTKIPVIKSSNIINIENKKYLIYNIIDLSEQKIMENLLKKNIEYEKIVSKITTRFFELDDKDKILNLSLKDIGTLTESNISFLLLFNENIQFEFKIYDWYSFEPKTKITKKIEKTDFEILKQTFKDVTALVLPDFNKLNEVSKKILDFSPDNNIDSAIFIPLFEDGFLCGIIGIEYINKNKNWEFLNIDILLTISQMIGIGITKFENIDRIINNYILLNRLIQTIPGPIYYKDKNNIFLGCNNKFADLIIGIPEEIIIGSTLNDNKVIIQNEELYSFFEQDKNILVNPEIKISEIKLFCTDKIERYFLSYKVTFNDAKDNLAGIVCIMLDITDRKRKEVEILKLSTAINQTQNLITIANKDGIIEYVNEGFKKVTGFNEIEIIGNDIIKIMSSLNSKIIIDNLGQTLSEGNIWKGELSNIKKNGEIFYEWSTITPVFDNYSQITNFINVSEDITQKKIEETEKEEIKRQLIEFEKFSAVGQLATGIAHEFNNILAIMKSTAQLIILKNDMKQVEIPFEIISELKTIEDNINRGSDIVSNLMTLSKPKELKQEFCQIENVIDEVLKIQKKQFEFENITIEQNYEKVPDLFIDCGQMHQVFLNLSINARHAMKIFAKGKIIISIKKIDSNVEIKFTDTGTGIKPEILDKIFLPFFSTKGAHSKDYLDIKGTGLGLSVSLSIIKNNNGNIKVESKENKGTTFIINFPIIEKKAEDDIGQNLTGEEENIRKYNSFFKIAIIDDEPKILENLKEFLIMNGYRNIKTFIDGNTFLSSFEKGNYGLALFDFYMPGLNGLQIFEKIIKIDNNIKVIFMTGNLEALENISNNKNISGVFKKPFDNNDILKIIDRLSIQ